MTKKIGILFCVLFLADEVKSQNKYGEDSVNCVINLSLYREYYKQKNYDDAIKPRFSERSFESSTCWTMQTEIDISMISIPRSWQ